MKVLMAEKVAIVAKRFERAFADDGECQILFCNHPEGFLETVVKMRPALLLISYDFLQEKLNTTLNHIHHLDPSCYMIVYLCPPSPDIKNELICAGASECLEASDGFDFLVGEAKKALIHLFDRNCFTNLPVTSSCEAVPEIVFSLDREGKFLYISSALNYLLGYDRDELIGEDISDLIANPSLGLKFRQYLQGSTDFESFNSILPLRTSLGIEEEFRVQANSMEDGIICGTARKMAPCISAEELLIAQRCESPGGPDLEESGPGTVFEQTMPARLGPYRVLSLLGEGAMGRVYKGFDEHLERYVAVKVVNGSALTSKSEGVENFRREARILASISHPNIALIYYFDICDNVPFFCMEYLDEGSLDSLLQKHRNLEPKTACSFVQQVALGLKQAQEKGVIHLDIKPSNLMVAEKNRIKIVDFGLSATHSTSNSDQIVGTPAYLAPEQIDSGAIDHRCDIYSLGITFFEMLYGFVPFSGNNVKEIFSKKLSENLPSLSTLNSTVPERLYQLIVQMTERDPDKRIQNYEELIEKLESAQQTLTHRAFSIRTMREESSHIRGNFHATPFAGLLARIWREKLSGRLTLNWLDLNKVIHFKAGDITAVLSNQEGERFIDLLISEKHLKPETAWQIRTAPSDLFTKFSSAMEMIIPEAREQLKSEFEDLSHKILDNLFGWAAGDFVFEQGEYPDQGNICISTSDVILRGIRHHADLSVISRALSHGKISIQLSENAKPLLRNLETTSSDQLLLSKIRRSIPFFELQQVSNLPTDHCYRIVYAFHCLGLIHFQDALPQQAETKTRNAETTESQKTPPNAPNFTDEYARKAADEYYQGNFWAAVQNCKKALEFKKDHRIYHLMGKALSKHMGFKYDAMRTYKQALELHPNDSSILKDMADLFLESGNKLMALSTYKRAIAANPRDEHCKAKVKEIEHGNDAGEIILKKLGTLFNGNTKKSPGASGF